MGNERSLGDGKDDLMSHSGNIGRYPIRRGKREPPFPIGDEISFKSGGSAVVHSKQIADKIVDFEFKEKLPLSLPIF
jgi:hypothetical protein